MTENVKFTKLIYDTVFDMVNAVHHDKPLIFIGLRFGRSSSPIIGQCMKLIPAYLCGV